MNSSKEYNFLVRQKGEELVKATMNLRKTLLLVSLIPDQLIQNIESKMEDVFDEIGSYKKGKTRKDMDKIISNCTRDIKVAILTESEKMIENITQIQMVTNLYFPKFKDAVEEFIGEDLNDAAIDENRDFTFYRSGKYDDLIKDLDDIRRDAENSEKICKDISNKLIDAAVEMVSAYTQKEVFIPSVFANSVDRINMNIKRVFSK